MISSLTTGCEKLDKLMCGGIPIGHITHIYGPAGTGKTTFALQCSVNSALNGYKTVFIDTEGSFSIERLKQISKDYFEFIVEKIIVFHPSTFSDQSDLIDILDDMCDKNTRLIIFDTITRLYRAELLEYRNTHILQHELNRQMAFLFKIAKQKNVAVLLTNQVRSSFKEEALEAVASSIINWWASIVIKFVREKGVKRRAEIVKHYSKPLGTSVTFFITSNGLK